MTNDGDTRKKPLLGLTLNELREVAASLAMPAYTASQIARWLYVRCAADIDDMTDISKRNRELLRSRYDIGLMPPIRRQCSADGTIKYLFPTASSGHVEAVYIPDGERATLCVSSQVGCRMRCLFCMTGRQGFEGNLTTADILNQIFALPERETLTNIVFMGQGEPMDNVDNVLKATEIMTADYGRAWSPKRITVSSVGVRNGLERFLNESECHVAISMHTPFADERASLMPAERAMPLAETLSLLGRYDFGNRRRLSFEYIVFAGVNDSRRHAEETARQLKGLTCRVNLIRFHPIPGTSLRGADDESVMRLRDYLTQHGVFATVRASRGQDIDAACGMLNTRRREENAPA